MCPSPTHSRKRAPNLSPHDRYLLGLWTIFLDPRRIKRAAFLVKPLMPMLLNELLKEYNQNVRQAKEIDTQVKEISVLKAQMTIVQAHNHQLQEVMGRLARLEAKGSVSQGTVVQTSHSE